MSKFSWSFSRNGNPPFLTNGLNFGIMVAVILTTVFGMFNFNSLSIILLLACRLFYGNPIDNLKTAFSNRVFLALFIYYLITLSGYLYTHNLVTQTKIVSKEATLVAVAFIFCAGEFADGRSYKRLVTAYSLSLVAASVYCLVLAWKHYQVNKDDFDFFYHILTAPISHNAVFFSVYMLFGIVFLLSRYGEPAFGFLPRVLRQILRYSLLAFFLGMMIMLSSRLFLVITPLILINIIIRRFSYRKRKVALLVAGTVLLVLVAILSTSDNFVRWRFREIKQGQVSVIHQKEFDPATKFSSWDSRLLQWRFAVEILNVRRGWVFGVSPGDSQDMLDQKYVDAHMYVGNPADGPDRHERGYLGYNFHDQFVETLVHSGLVGLASLLAIFILLFAAARRTGLREAWFVNLIILVFFIPEAPLTLQWGVFILAYFPLLALAMPRKVNGSG